MAIEIKENMPLAPLTTMRAGGSARFFTSVKTGAEIGEAAWWAREKNLPIFILGGGSNTLVPDAGFPGLVVKIDICGTKYESTHHGVCVYAGAGEVWDDLVRDSVLRNLWGLENLSLIPGTVGGAAVQNIGAYGVEAKQSIHEVEVFDIEKKELRKISGHKCKLGYRDSIFKNNKNLVVISVAFNLVHNATPHTEYEDVKKYFSDKNTEHLTPQKVRDAIIAIRTAKMPGLEIGTAGSFFKNPVVSAEKFEELKGLFPEIKAHLQGDGTAKVSAAWLLDKVGGFRGYRRGDAGVFEKQSLIVVNHGNATSTEIISLANEMKQEIKNKTGISLEEEVVMMSE